MVSRFGCIRLKAVSLDGGPPSSGLWDLTDHQIRIRMVLEVSAIVNIAWDHGVAAEMTLTLRFAVFCNVVPSLAPSLILKV